MSVNSSANSALVQEMLLNFLHIVGCHCPLVPPLQADGSGAGRSPERMFAQDLGVLEIVFNTSVIPGRVQDPKAIWVQVLWQGWIPEHPLK